MQKSILILQSSLHVICFSLPAVVSSVIAEWLDCTQQTTFPRKTIVSDVYERVIQG